MSWSIGQLLIIVLIVVLLFGTKKLSSLGSDLGASLKGFRKAIKDEDEPTKSPDADFAAKSLADESAAASPASMHRQEKTKSQDKEQV